MDTAPLTGTNGGARGAGVIGSLMGGADSVSERYFNEYRSRALPLVSWTASEIRALAAARQALG